MGDELQPNWEVWLPAGYGSFVQGRSWEMSCSHMQPYLLLPLGLDDADAEREHLHDGAEEGPRVLLPRARIDERRRLADAPHLRQKSMMHAFIEWEDAAVLGSSAWG